MRFRCLSSSETVPHRAALLRYCFECIAQFMAINFANPIMGMVNFMQVQKRSRNAPDLAAAAPCCVAG